LMSHATGGAWRVQPPSVPHRRASFRTSTVEVRHAEHRKRESGTPAVPMRSGGELGLATARLESCTGIGEHERRLHAAEDIATKADVRETPDKAPPPLLRLPTKNIVNGCTSAATGLRPKVDGEGITAPTHQLRRRLLVNNFTLLRPRSGGTFVFPPIQNQSVLEA
jgi:hypothetical protein